MKFSVIIPALNEEKLLPNLLGQLTVPELRSAFDIEIIVADGGSHDKTQAIALDKSDIVVTQTESENRNISSGRNLGAQFAQGEIMIFLNADVIIEKPHAFFSYIRDKFQPSDYAAMTCRVETFPDERDFRDIVFHTFYNFYFFLLNCIGVGMGRGECHIIRKNAFCKAGGYRTDLPAGEDFDLFRRIKLFGKIDFARKLCIYESPRRYRKYGYLKVAFSWTVNAFSILSRNKSNSDTWEAIR